ncbi:hypothetical protein OIU76_022763 [Salix suchowensis]|nr:hypothetical protein OIU76_022763 [Salix suchowensis]
MTTSSISPYLLIIYKFASPTSLLSSPSSTSRSLVHLFLYLVGHSMCLGIAWPYFVLKKLALAVDHQCKWGKKLSRNKPAQSPSQKRRSKKR